MGCKADGAAQGYTVLGGIVLAYFAIQMIVGGLNTFSGGDINGLIVLIQGIALILMVVLSFDASGFVSWKVGKSGALLALFGFLSIIWQSHLRCHCVVNEYRHSCRIYDSSRRASDDVQQVRPEGMQQLPRTCAILNVL
jgi:hypothetical protein